jgi:hypothetical protein
VIIGGTVTDSWVIDGTATLSGQIDADVMVVIDGLNLTSCARVDHLALVSGEMSRGPGAAITGDLSEQSSRC